MVPEYERLAPNLVRFFDSEGRGYWFSYTTLVAFKDTGKDPLVRENDWGTATGRHLNAIDGGGKAAKAHRVPGDKFTHAVSFRLNCAV